MATIAYKQVGDTMILAHAKTEPADEEWRAYVEALRAHSVKRILVLTDGEGPNARQRKHMLERLGANAQRTAVVTPSMAARGIVTAVAWLGTDIRAFAPDETAAALEFLGLTRFEAEAVLRSALRVRLTVLGRDAAHADELVVDEVRTRLARWA